MAKWVKVEGGRGSSRRVAVYDVDGLLWLRWTWQGERYSLGVELAHTNAGLKAARTLASRVESDLAHDREWPSEAPLFDPTLAKYRPGLAKPVSQTPTTGPTTIELWDMFTEYRRANGTGGVSISGRYKPMRANLERFGKTIADEPTAREFMDMIRGRQSASSSSGALSMLRGFGRWAVQAGHWQTNHFDSISPLKISQKPRRDAFTADEVQRFLAAIKTDSYYWRYHDFAYALFHLGCRPSELIGLRWQHIDLERGLVTICESLSRGENGQTAGYARQRRGTKTGSIRYLPLAADLLAMFRGRRPVDASPDALVFTAPRGGPIDDHLLSQRCWRAICEKAGIPYRSPYTARHTCLSHIVEQTGSLAQAAAVAGHANLAMVSKTYGHLVTGIQLPRYSDPD
ncbi:MAG: tyrosine-type recombinase/integrase [Gloeomargaritaceae cyanobacterium C42_A2020_066]|nr:tyrosine-type recombinase/integrase [Gloeomargaritaceae cyanobacterium C42_A2020_066]